MANDVISPLKKGTGSEPNRPGAGETTAPRSACTLLQWTAIPCPDAQFHAQRNEFVTYVNGDLADLGLAAGDPAPTGPSELSFLSGDTGTPHVVD